MAEFVVRQARPDDAQAMAQLLAAVAEERADRHRAACRCHERAGLFARAADASVVADADGEIVGMICVEVSRFGFGEFGMLVDGDSRSRGVGLGLVQAAIAWARRQGLQKLCLEVFASNTAAIALHRRLGC